MKNIKNILKKNRLLQVVTLFVLVFVANSFPMRMPSEQRKVAVKKAMRQTTRKNQYFIHETNNPENGIWVDKDFVKANCKSIKLMIEDLGSELTEIPLDCSVATIKLVFDVLGNEIDVIDLGLQELIDITNVFNYLDVPADKMNIVVARIKKDVIDASDTHIATNQLLKKLNPDIQKLLLTERAIDYLKDFIVKKYVNDRKKILIDDLGRVNAVAFSPDGTQMVSSEDSYGVNKLLLWNMSDSNSNATIKKELLGYQGKVVRIAWSPNGKYMISGSTGNQNNLLLWDINDLDNPQPLVGHPKDVNVVAFSFDGKYIVSGSDGDQDNLIVWDITNPKAIIHQVLVGHPTGAHTGVFTVAFSPDATQIISGSKGHQDNLILWNMNNWGINSSGVIITSQKLDGHPHTVLKVLFSSDGQKILSVSYADVWTADPASKDSILLWDISDPNNIRHQWLDDNCCCSKSAVFSPDDRSIVSVCMHSKNVTLWDVADFNNITSKNLVGHSHGVWSVAFSPDGRKIVSAGECGTYLTGNNLILWDVSDRNNITHQSLKGHPYYVYKIAFSSDGKKMVSGGAGRYANLILWTLLTDQEEVLLNQLKNYNADQVRLIYQLCLQSLKGQSIALKEGSEERAIFMTLPEDMQKLLVDLFFSKGWFSWSS